VWPCSTTAAQPVLSFSRPLLASQCPLTLRDVVRPDGPNSVPGPGGVREPEILPELAGVRAEHLDGTTPIVEREAILSRLASGETEVVSNCMVLTEGWDMPAVGCLILARPTKQMGLYRQMIGRVLRPADGKTNAITLDHSGAVYRHGLPEDHVEWTLDVDRRAENPAQAARKHGEEPCPRECPSCQTVMTIPPCLHCGWQPALRRGRDVDFLMASWA
jgi:superfamily II DNA or RNA helicase